MSATTGAEGCEKTPLRRKKHHFRHASVVVTISGAIQTLAVKLCSLAMSVEKRGKEDDRMGIIYAAAGILAGLLLLALLAYFTLPKNWRL